jgi:hypothetical protein
MNEAGGGADLSQQEYYYYYQRRGMAQPTPSSTGIVSMSLDGLAATVMLKVTFGLK